MLSNQNVNEKKRLLVIVSKSAHMLRYLHQKLSNRVDYSTAKLKLGSVPVLNSVTYGPILHCIVHIYKYPSFWCFVAAPAFISAENFVDSE